MRIMSLSGAGVLSFDQFEMGLSERVTFLVGPNGAGKSNLTRLLSICQRVIEITDESVADADRLLAPLLAARHFGPLSTGLQARVAIRLTDIAERELVTAFIRALVTFALIRGYEVQNVAEIDAWLEAEITEDKLQPLMEGEIVASHPGTPDGRWQCAYEFTARGHDQAMHRYRWILLPQESHGIFDADAPVTARLIDVTTRITGSSSAPSGPEISVPDSFHLLDLLPKREEYTLGGSFTVWGSGTRTESRRRFARLAGLPPDNGHRAVGLAAVLRIILQRTLVQTSDTRLLPSGGASWSASELPLGAGAEARLPDLLARLKNGDPAERARYRRIRNLFVEFTQGRSCEVRLLQVQQPAQDGQASIETQVPAIWVTVNASDGSTGLDPEVPIEFAGAGAWEALVLASVLSESSASVVVLDEPAVALHPSLQRQLGAHLLSATAQFLVITHSAELLPLGGAAAARLVRLDRDDKSATRAWPVDEACRTRMARKLVAKGNERLPFAWRAILCEGQDDVEAIMTLTERMGIDLRRRNIAVADCGSRDNLPDYVWFCAELGLKYLAVMDADSVKSAALPKAQAVRDTLSLRHGGELAEFPENLEATFGVLKQRPSLVPAAVRALPFTGDMPDPSQAPPEVVALAEALRRLTK